MLVDPIAGQVRPQVSVEDRAGHLARLRDVEFIQFHPTVLFLGTGARGQLPLVSEAVRGEGGLLVNSAGDRFMVGQHELAELAPRDVVAKAIMKEMAREGTDHVYVDGRALGEETWRVRFPTILHSCRVAGIDPVTDLIPVAPAAHYFCGGVETDLEGATNLPGLYACGEVASSGVHGANRLASNSLLEGLVFAVRIAGSLARAPDHARAVAGLSLSRSTSSPAALRPAEAGRSVRRRTPRAPAAGRDGRGTATEPVASAVHAPVQETWTETAPLPADCVPGAVAVAVAGGVAGGAGGAGGVRRQRLPPHGREGG